MVRKMITLSDILNVTGARERICLYNEEGTFIVNIESEKAKKYISGRILNREVEKIEGRSGEESRNVSCILVTLKKRKEIKTESLEAESQETGREDD